MADAAAPAAPGAVGAAGASSVPRYRDTFHALRSIVRTEGVRGLFAGLGPTVLTNAPYSGAWGACVGVAAPEWG